MRVAYTPTSTAMHQYSHNAILSGVAGMLMQSTLKRMSVKRCVGVCSLEHSSVVLQRRPSLNAIRCRCFFIHWETGLWPLL